MRSTIVYLTFIFLTCIAIFVLPASAAYAMSMKECGALYRTAEAAGTLNGQSWNGFRLAQCGGSANASVGAETLTVAAANTPTPSAAGSAVFPTAVDPQYAKETPRSARFKTCVAQYRANKASNANGGMKWVQKGGGYYSECTKRLKAAKSA